MESPDQGGHVDAMWTRYTWVESQKRSDCFSLRIYLPGPAVDRSHLALAMCTASCLSPRHIGKVALLTNAAAASCGAMCS